MAITAALTCGQEKPSSAQQRQIVELTVYLLSGVAQGDTADDVPSGSGRTVKQLRSIFNYKSYKLTESFMLRGRLGASASAAGHACRATQAYGMNSGTARYRLPRKLPPVFQITGLNITLIKNGFYRRDSDGKSVPDILARITTDLDIREGQKTVVGKSSISSTGDALILVIVPKLVQ